MLRSDTNPPMPRPKLSRLQALFAATLAATLTLLVASSFALGPHFAHAIDTDSISQIDHNHPIPHTRLEFGELEPRDVPVIIPDDDAADGETTERDGGEIGTRPPPEFALENNVLQNDNVRIGETRNWYFPKESRNLSSTSRIRSNDGESGGSESDDSLLDVENDAIDSDSRATTVYVTANTCLQPDLNATRMAQDAGAPQLRLYISQSEKFQEPGPGIDDPAVTSKNFTGGYVRIDLPAGQDVYIGVAALNTSRYTGVYNYDIAASFDEPFHSVETESPGLYFVDSDSHAALLVTKALTQEYKGEEYDRWMNMDTPPYTMFAHSINDSAIIGLHNSSCGLRMNAQVKKNHDNVGVGIASRGPDNLPKQQFYINKLNASSSYYGFMVQEPNSTLKRQEGGVIGGGGRLWKSMNFTTKSDGNCAVVYDLRFCSDVAYAVPSNPSLNISQLIKIYDDNAVALYKNFTYSLQQIPCNATDESQYSLARNCEYCARAYKQWLCAVTIPRCHDFTSSLKYLQPRSVGYPFLNGTMLPNDEENSQQQVLHNSSRNPLIDTEIKPGPYKEVLPCRDLCHELVQSCPSALGFQCPRKDWLKKSYGERTPNDITCSYFGAAFFMSGAQGMYGRNVFVFGIGIGGLGLVVFWSLVWGLIWIP